MYRLRLALRLNLRVIVSGRIQLRRGRDLPPVPGLFVVTDAGVHFDMDPDDPVNISALDAFELTHAAPHSAWSNEVAP